jgi:hypothetical protein
LNSSGTPEPLMCTSKSDFVAQTKQKEVILIVGKKEVTLS